MSVKVICNHVSGKSKGYGFVHFTTENAASNALKEMNGKVSHTTSTLVALQLLNESLKSIIDASLQLLDGRNIRVLYAHRR